MTEPARETITFAEIDGTPVVLGRNAEEAFPEEVDVAWAFMMDAYEGRSDADRLDPEELFGATFDGKELTFVVANGRATYERVEDDQERGVTRFRRTGAPQHHWSAEDLDAAIEADAERGP